MFLWSASNEYPQLIQKKIIAELLSYTSLVRVYENSENQERCMLSIVQEDLAFPDFIDSKELTVQ